MKAIRTIAAIAASIITVSAFSVLTSARTYIEADGTTWSDGVNDGIICVDDGDSFTEYDTVLGTYDVYTYSSKKTYYIGEDAFFGSVYYRDDIGYYAFYSNYPVELGYDFVITPKTSRTSRKSYDPAMNAGLGFSAPDYSISGYTFTGYDIIGSIYEMQYLNKYGDYLEIRKAKGNFYTPDTSDLYIDYVTTWKFNNMNITLEGSDNYYSVDYYVASWSKNGFSYSVKADHPLTLNEIKNIVKDTLR